MTDERVAQKIPLMTNPDGLRQLMKNVRTHGREDLYWSAFQRLCEVLGQASYDSADPLVWRLEQSVRASEELRGGRRAARTRQMMKLHGATGTIKRWLTYPSPTYGYDALVKAGLWRLLGEAIPLDFPDRFTESERVVALYRVNDAKQGRVSEPFLPEGQSK